MDRPKVPPKGGEESNRDRAPPETAPPPSVRRPPDARWARETAAMPARDPRGFYGFPPDHPSASIPPPWAAWSQQFGCGGFDGPPPYYPGYQYLRSMGGVPHPSRGRGDLRPPGGPGGYPRDPPAKIPPAFSSEPPPFRRHDGGGRPDSGPWRPGVSMERHGVPQGYPPRQESDRHPGREPGEGPSTKVLRREDIAPPPSPSSAQKQSKEASDATDSDDKGGVGSAQNHSRAGAMQARLWQYMHPYTAQGGGRNVECCILVPAEDDTNEDGTRRMRKCGATFKHTMGGSTTNLLRHLRKKHPEEARVCLEGSKNSNLYKTMQAEMQKAIEGQKTSRREPDNGKGLEKPGKGEDKKAQWNTVVDSLVRAGINAEIKCQISVRMLALFCAVDLHPYCCALEPGLQSFLLGNADQPILPKQTELENIIFEERRLVMNKIRKLFRSQQSFVSDGPFCSLQLDSWTSPGSGTAYAVASATLLTSSFEMQRVGLDVRAFPADYTATDISRWLRSFTDEAFDSTPDKVFVACTVSGGSHFLQAVNSFRIPVLKCAVQRLNEVVMSALRPTSLKETHTGLMRRVKELAKFVLAKPREDKLVSLQEAIVRSVGQQVEAETPSAALALFLAILHGRRQLMDYFEALPESGDIHCYKLDESDWVIIAEVAGLLEVCAEVDRNLRSSDVSMVPNTVILLRELCEYMGEDVLYIPDMKSPDAPWLERGADDLNAVTKRVRRNLADTLTSERIGALASKEERLACALDVCNCELLLDDAEEATLVWQELNEIATPASHNEGGSSSTTEFCADQPQAKQDEADEKGKQKWKGALTMRMLKRKKEMQQKSKGVESDSETAKYKHMTQVMAASEEDADTLSWWAAHTSVSATPEAKEGAADSAKAPATQFPVLSRHAARFLSIDPSSMQASVLMGAAGYRVAGLENTAGIRNMENMLFLRLNKNLIAEMPSLPP